MDKHGLSKKLKKGFKAPKNYDPARGKKRHRGADESVRPRRSRGAQPRGFRSEREDEFVDSAAGGRGRRTEFAGERGRGAARSERGERPARWRGERDEHRGSRRDGSGRGRSSRQDRDGGYGRDRRAGGRDSFVPRERKGFQPEEDVVLEKLAALQTSSEDVAGVTFADLGLGSRLVAALAEMGADAPFAIQAATIPDVLAGRDVLGRGRTGSGKTIAFGASLVERLLQMREEGLFENDPPKPKRARGKRQEFTQGRTPKALIMAPTRELALQIDRTVQPLAQAVGLFTTQLVGGAPIERQKNALRRGVDIVVGTPGRVEDLIERGNLDISQVAIAVLDEADHMAELGFIEPVQRIWRGIAPGAQKLLFSATLDTQVSKVVKEFLVDPAVHEVVDAQQGSIDHNVLVVLREDKDAVLTELLDATDGPAIVFTRTRAYAEMLRDVFEDAGIAAVDLHGNLNQARRERNLKRFSQGRARVLVATDVAARGIHVDDVSLVVQADPPDDYKSYLHRSGRTGRAGSDGTVVTVIPRNRQKRTRQMFSNAQLEASYFGDFEPGDRQGWHD